MLQIGFLILFIGIQVQCETIYYASAYKDPYSNNLILNLNDLRAVNTDNKKIDNDQYFNDAIQKKPTPNYRIVNEINQPETSINSKIQNSKIVSYNRYEHGHNPIPFGHFGDCGNNEWNPIFPINPVVNSQINISTDNIDNKKPMSSYEAPLFHSNDVILSNLQKAYPSRDILRSQIGDNKLNNEYYNFGLQPPA